jgi:hypothetical protein
MKNFLARLIGAYDNRRDRRAWQASTSEPDLIDGDTAAAPPAGSDVYGACTVDEPPAPLPADHRPEWAKRREEQLQLLEAIYALDDAKPTRGPRR